MTATAVDAAMGRDGWTEQYAGAPNRSYVFFVDVGTVHDPTVIGWGHREQGMTYLDGLRTFQGSREAPVQLVAVEQMLAQLATTFRPSKTTAAAIRRLTKAIVAGGELDSLVATLQTYERHRSDIEIRLRVLREPEPAFDAKADLSQAQQLCSGLAGPSPGATSTKRRRCCADS